MNHRCLYGHRVSQEYRFSIRQRVCPTCGAPTVTTAGYGLARKLATRLSIEAVTAFQAIQLVEEEYTLAQRTEEPEIPEESVAEIEIGDEDIEDTHEVLAAEVSDPGLTEAEREFFAEGDGASGQRP